MRSRSYVWAVVVRLGVAVSLALGLGGAARAQTFPIKPIRLVVGLPAGGGADIIARYFAASLAERLGQAVVIENRPGSGGLVAADAVAKSDPDGYTLLFGTVSSHAIFASLYPKLPYDPVKDFAPISLLATYPLVLVVRTSLPITSLGEFVAYAKANPGRLSYASAGYGSPLHLSMEMLKSRTGIDVVHVPYKGGVEAMRDLMRGEIHVIFDALPTQLANIKAGKVRALAVTTAVRVSQLPDVPTMSEAGVTAFEFTGWFAAFAPSGVPATVLAKLRGDVAGVLNTSSVREGLKQFGVDAADMPSVDLARFQQSEIAKWAKAVKDSGASVQ